MGMDALLIRKIVTVRLLGQSLFVLTIIFGTNDERRFLLVALYYDFVIDIKEANLDGEIWVYSRINKGAKS